MLIAWVPGCDHKSGAPPASAAKHPTVASLVPSATDLILGMGAGDHLVAVSGYDREPGADRLPRVGDYETIDWEKVAQLRPNLIITYYGVGHVPAGFEQRTRDLGMQNLNLKFDRLTDVFVALGTLGDAVAEPGKAQALARRLNDSLDALRPNPGSAPAAPVRALIVTDPSGLDFAGRGNYLDDLLDLVGGQNAIARPGYVALDREAIAALKPDVILHLLPGADEAAKQRAATFWDTFPELPAVKRRRVYLFTESYMMTPGVHVADVAARFADALHPKGDPASHPTSTNATP